MVSFKEKYVHQIQFLVLRYKIPYVVRIKFSVELLYIV